MTTVRVTRMENRIPPGPVPDASPTHVIVLADAAGHRELPVWLLGGDSHRFAGLFDPPDPATGRAVTARPGTRPPGTASELTARLLSAADTLMDRLATPAAGNTGPGPAGLPWKACRTGCTGPCGRRAPWPGGGSQASPSTRCPAPTPGRSPRATRSWTQRRHRGRRRRCGTRSAPTCTACAPSGASCASAASSAGNGARPSAASSSSTSTAHPDGTLLYPPARPRPRPRPPP